MATDSNNLVRLTKDQIKPTAKMFSRAFQNDPMCTYWIPNATERRKMSHYVLGGIIRFGVLYGEVYATSDNLEGAVSWVPSEKADFTTWRCMHAFAHNRETLID